VTTAAGGTLASFEAEDFKQRRNKFVNCQRR
jgi:hypothetical protein